jgi:ATP-dependent DNA ligase
VLPDGRTAFNLIQNASDTGQGSLVFFLFDLLFVDGRDITGPSRMDLQHPAARSMLAVPTSR